MLVRVALVAMALCASAAGQALSQGNQEDPIAATLDQNAAEGTRIEERTLADLETGMDAFVLSSSQAVTRIRFYLPPNTYSSEAWLRLAARPASDGSNGRIQVAINGGEAIIIRPQPRAIEARFALFSADIQPGENVLEVSYSTETATTGWIVDARRSQLRLTLEQDSPIASLDELELALAADFAAPRRIALITDISRERATLESLVAQGVALRAGSVPLFGGDEANADLVIRIAENDRLQDGDRAVLRAGNRSQGPEIAFGSGEVPRLVVTGRNLDEAVAAARLFAARSFEGYGRSFVAADAITAQRLGRAQIRDARRLSANADLRTLAASGLPFSADQGSRTAVQFTTRTRADRFGALSVLARGALVSGEAWLYAWYGEEQDHAPANHNLLIIGPGSSSIAALGRSAPAEFGAAMRAAERSRGQRGLMRLAAAAYADESASTATEEDGTSIGVASLFRDSEQTGRWIGTLTSPELSSFESASRSLARSNLWHALEGRAAVWSVRGVTPLDYSVSAPGLQERAQEFALDHTRDAAFMLFGIASLMLIRGIWRRRRVHAS
tara:strand:- start:3267 stop:4946 length:1680 start_codon:yes stop_codon:yes gene_type:complete